MREYRFELSLCAHLEAETGAIVARQLGGGVHGGGHRIIDIVVIDPGAEFDERRVITDETIPPLAIESHVGTGRARRWPGPLDISPETADRLLEEAVRVGFFERDRRDGANRVRQAVRYPDWIGSITAIENKPDLGSPGSLSSQLRRDVSLGLVDRVILATASHVTGAHRNRIPAEVGIWRVRMPDGQPSIEVIREPDPLDPTGWGLEIGERGPVATRVRAVSPDDKARARVRLAERAYGSGWRPDPPACAEARTTTVCGSEGFIYCDWKERIVNPGGCGPACAGHEPADPPAIDARGEREARTPWVADPPGVARKQAGLSGFDRRDRDLSA